MKVSKMEIATYFNQHIGKLIKKRDVIDHLCENYNLTHLSAIATASKFFKVAKKIGAIKTIGQSLLVVREITQDDVIEHFLLQ